MAVKNLKNKAVSGVLWTSIQKFATIAIQFVSSIILARLLTPADYGCIGMLAIFMLVSESIIDAGFGSALIQKKRPTQVDYSTIFFLNFGLACILYAILFFSAPAISRFYRIDLLCPVLRTQGLVLFVDAFRIVQVNQLKKQFRFKKISIVQLSSTAVALATTILLAYNGFGVWALVAQNILLALLPTIVYWLTNHWKPMLVFSTKSFKELFSFGFYMFLTHLIATIVTNIQGLLIGRLYNASTMGYYSKAQSTEKLVSTSISQVVMQVTYPLYAELQDTRDRLASVIQRLTMGLSYITFPLLFLLILLAEPIFTLLYSERWLPSVPYFQMLCLAGVAQCLHAVNSQSIAAIGKSKAMFYWSLVKQGFGLVCVLVGLISGGMKGLLIGVVVRSWSIYLINAALVDHYIGYKLGRQLLDILPVLILSLVSFFVSFFVCKCIGGGLYLNGTIAFLVFVAIYVVCSLSLKLKAYYICKDLAIPYFSRVFGKILR